MRRSFFSLFPPPDQQSGTNIALLTTDPFGDAPHLAGLEPKLKSNVISVSATDPKELKSLLDASKKVDTSNNSRLKVVPIKNVRVSNNYERVYFLELNSSLLAFESKILELFGVLCFPLCGRAAYVFKIIFRTT